MQMEIATAKELASKFIDIDNAMAAGLVWPL